MTNNDIDRLVAENRRQIRQIGGRFVQVDSSRDRDISFGPSVFEVSVDVDVFRRSTGNQMVVGHPDASKGFGMGSFGDDKGEWEQINDPVATVEFTKQGRRAVVRALDGQDGAVVEGGLGGGSGDYRSTAEAMSVGTWGEEYGFGNATFGYGGAEYVVETTTDATDPASTEDTQLGHELSRSPVVAPYRTGNVGTYPAIYTATDVVGTPEEFGIFDGAGRLLARVTVDIPDGTISDTDEVRADVSLTFDGDGAGTTTITEDGEEAVADAVSFPTSSTGPVEFAFGTGTDTFDKTDTSLTSEAFRKPNERIADRDRLIARTHVYESEPAGQMPIDIGELAVFDDDGRMIWAAAFDTFRKRDTVAFNAESEFRAK